jgi:hypothetical protein
MTEEKESPASNRQFGDIWKNLGFQGKNRHIVHFFVIFSMFCSCSLSGHNRPISSEWVLKCSNYGCIMGGSGLISTAKPANVAKNHTPEEL